MNYLTPREHPKFVCISAEVKDSNNNTIESIKNIFQDYNWGGYYFDDSVTTSYGNSNIRISIPLNKHTTTDGLQFEYSNNNTIYEYSTENYGKNHITDIHNQNISLENNYNNNNITINFKVFQIEIGEDTTPPDTQPSTSSSKQEPTFNNIFK